MSDQHDPIKRARLDYIAELNREHTDRLYCPVCGELNRKFEDHGVARKRKNARCPNCKALERHRAFWVSFVNNVWGRLPAGRKKLLHLAPEPVFTELFRALDGIDYLSGDLKMPSAMVKLDLTDIQFPDEQFDVIICSHVLEHIPDDRKAMREMFRVTRPGGFVLVMVPTQGAETYEDSSITTPEARTRHFGQHDHVRMYGRDIADRLSEAGFEVNAWPPSDRPVSSEIAFIAARNRIVFECQKPAGKPVESRREKDQHTSNLQSPVLPAGATGSENREGKAGAPTPVLQDVKCNLCGGKTFSQVKMRPLAKCDKCSSMERTRLLWMYVQKFQLTPETRVLHLAPERGLYRALSKRLNAQNYVCADIDPSRYKFAENMRKIDLCALDDQASDEYDLIIHSHVMEHVPCNIAYTLFHLHRMLKPNGKQVCVIPFTPGRYDESFSDIGDKERTRRFGQRDHVRRFGAEDIGRHLGSIMKLPATFDATESFSQEELRRANIPETAWRGFTINTVLQLGKLDMKLLQPH